MKPNEEIMEFLKENPTFYLATVDGYLPRVRPIGFAMWYNGHLCIALGKHKAAYKQLLDNTNLEICAANDRGEWLRVQGTANFDNSPEAQAAAFQVMPQLADMYNAETGNKLGIVYYDDLLLKKAAEESGLCEELFHSFDERPKSFLYSIAMDPYSFTMHHVTPKGSIEQQVYLATYDTIKKLADKGPCVLIGRCADYALKDRDDVINLFISAPLESRIKRVAARNNISEAKERIKKTDKSRASYYNYYSSKDWGEAKSYDLCIDSSLLGIEGTVALLEEMVKLKGMK